jgi:hypothetical protein
MVKKVVRRLHYSEEYCYGFRVGLEWRPLTSRDQYSSCAPRLNIPNKDHHLLMPPYVHSISAGRPAVPDSAVLVFLGLLESARGTAGGCLCLGDFVPHDSGPLRSSSSPDAAFSFLSGNGADPTGRSRLAFARYKGEAEKALLAAGFRAFTSSGLHTSIPWGHGRNRTSATGLCARSTPRSGHCSPTR